MPRTVISQQDLALAPRRLSKNTDSEIDLMEDRQLAKTKRRELKNVDMVLDHLGSKPDDYATRLIKYIPAEVIALYLTLDGLLRPTRAVPLPSAKVTAYWMVFIFGIAITPLYLWRVQKVHKFAQLAISTIAFVVWVYALGGPFQLTQSYEPLYGSILLPVYTFLIAIFEA